MQAALVALGVLVLASGPVSLFSIRFAEFRYTRYKIDGGRHRPDTQVVVQASLALWVLHK
jgi:hypothetical protein